MTDQAPADDPDFEAILELLRSGRSLDFTGYKRTSLERRVRRRMDQLEIATFADYLDRLEVDPDEYERLLDVILINVTEFFRDPAAWEHLRDTTLPALLAERGAEEPIRVWSAGCATGQEAYTAAMVLCEVLGTDAYRDRVKIYATDIDEVALAVARQATYDARQVESLPQDLLERYFDRREQRHAFREDLRRALIFGRNNLVSDAPISRLDLLVCRNTLMYFNADTQVHVLGHFHFGLREGGILMLGRSEVMTAHRERFAADDLRKRIFRKLPQPVTRRARVTGTVEPEPPVAERPRDGRAHEAAFDAAPQAQLIVSPAGTISDINGSARTLFGVGDDAIGRPLADAPIDLREPVESALRDRRRVVVADVPFRAADGKPHQLAVTAVPLEGSEGAPAGVSVVIEDVTRYASMQEDLERSRHDLEAAYEELQSTIDELETTNEELQSANEELQTTNEELQSTNEELETMNEELQSTNEELATINDELRDRTAELNRVNDFLEVIFSSLAVAIAVVDRHGRVQVWNRAAEDLWGVRPEEAVEEHFLALDIGLAPERLAAALRSVIAGGDPHTATLEAVNRRGKAIRCAVSVLPLVSAGGEDGGVRGAIVLMEDADGDGTRFRTRAAGVDGAS